MAFVGRKPTNAPLTADDIPNGIIGAADLASGISGLITWQSVQTTGFTAVAGRGYPLNTTSAAFTVTLPASPSVGDTIILVDYAGTFATNNLTITSTLKINGSNNDVILTTNREATTLVYVDATQGWVASSGVNEGTAPSLTDSPPTYTSHYLVIAGGGGGGFNQAAGGGAGGFLTSYPSGTPLTIAVGTNYPITVGAGGAGSTSVGSKGTSGANSIFSTVTSTGGGGGGSPNTSNGDSGGSGGGGSGAGSGSGASGTVNQGFAGGNGFTNGATYAQGGGGGGASAVGGNGSNSLGGTGGVGGAGLANSITGTSVTRAGGGGGGVYTFSSATRGLGGVGGGGNGGDSSAPTSGTANTGSGGGGGSETQQTGGNGGSGVVILRIATANYSGTTTGSPTVTTDGTDTVIVFNASGSYTA